MMRYVYVHVLIYLYLCLYKNTGSIIFIPARKYQFIIVI